MRNAKRGFKSKRKGKGGARRPRVPRAPRSGVREWASMTENKPSSPLLLANQMYQVYNLQLKNFRRASAVAKGYQLYRIKRCTVKLSPLVDTFSPSGGAPLAAVPYLYYMIDRTKNLIAANTQTTLKQCGAIPRRLDEKVISFSWAPSVLTATLDEVPGAGQAKYQFTQYKISPWLNTRDSDQIATWQPDSTDHLGVVWYVESNGAISPINYKCELIVEFEFKKPSVDITRTVGEPEPVPIFEEEVSEAITLDLAAQPTG